MRRREVQRVISGPRLGVALGSPPRVPNVANCEFIAPSAFVLGDVELGKRTSVWYGAVLRGDTGRITVAAKTNIQDGAVLHGEVSIGENVTVGHRATVHGCEIGDGVLVGIGAIILSGARVLPGSIVAAGAVVREYFVVPEKTLVAGVPARIVRETTADERADLNTSGETYVRLARAHSLAWRRMDAAPRSSGRHFDVEGRHS